MFRFKYFKNDFKQIKSDYIMVILFFCPILIAIAFRMMMEWLMPFLFDLISRDMNVYKPYILSMVLCFSPIIMGIVTGFMMVDDKDSHIIELISVTPLERSGYFINRAGFALFATIIQVLFSYAIIGIYIMDAATMFIAIIMFSMLAFSISLLFYSVASDKIKGLTYAKGLNLIIIFVFADLLKGDVIKNMSLVVPTYWITEIIINPKNTVSLLLGLLCCLLWLLIIGSVGKRRLNESI